MASPEIFDIPIGNVVGPPGNTGNGIAGIVLLSTSGLQKTYRITMTDETTFDFTVADGNGISGATFDAQTNALTLTFQNGTTYTTPSLKGTKGDTGNGISRIEKTGTEGLVDTYTVTYTDGQTFTYTVTNGAKGDPGDDYVLTARDKTDIANIVRDLMTVTLTGRDITLTAEAETRYICGELDALTLTPPASGVVDVLFTSGTTPTVVSLPATVQMPEWYLIEANQVYEINILDGVYGTVMSWPA